jgi:hypothetical protein
MSGVDGGIFKEEIITGSKEILLKGNPYPGLIEIIEGSLCVIAALLLRKTIQLARRKAGK